MVLIPASARVFHWLQRTLRPGDVVSYQVLRANLPEIHEHDLCIALDILVESGYLREKNEDLYVLI